MRRLLEPALQLLDELILILNHFHQSPLLLLDIVTLLQLVQSLIVKLLVLFESALHFLHILTPDLESRNLILKFSDLELSFPDSRQQLDFEVVNKQLLLVILKLKVIRCQTVVLSFFELKFFLITDKLIPEIFGLAL
jgi:hypothetical protein